jgi:hypothetical protein
METKSSFETSVTDYSSTRRLVAEDFNLHQQSCKKCKSKKTFLLNGRMAADKNMTNGKSFHQQTSISGSN